MYRPRGLYSGNVHSNFKQRKPLKVIDVDTSPIESSHTIAYDC